MYEPTELPEESDARDHPTEAAAAERPGDEDHASFDPDLAV